MKKNLNFLLILALCVISMKSYSQNKVLLTGGTTLNSSSVVINKENVQLNVEGQVQSINKEEILCIIPHGKTGYTFHQKKNKKLKISKKDIYYNYEGTDIPRIYAYKYIGSSYTAEQLYHLNSANSLTEDEFTSVFNAQQKTLKNRAIVAGAVSIVLGVAAFLIGYSSFKSSLDDLNSFSNNNLDMKYPLNMDKDLKYIPCNPGFYLALKECA